MTSEVVVRRNYILDRMKTESPLSGKRHKLDEYEAAKVEPVILAPQLGVQWKAPHFIWQVRIELARILCPGLAVDACEKIDTGGYHVISTLDVGMQETAEKWVYAAARAPNLKNTDTLLDNLEIPSGDRAWLRNLRGKNIHNGAAAVMDYRTGEILAYVGSGSYNSEGNEKFQPQYDVLSDGWRQPGSSIKPINYAIGIEDRTMTAATMFMDVTTDFGRGYSPTQADDLERGPVRLRSALQFSLNIPSIKAGVINGLDHFYERSKDFGVSYFPGSVPVVSMGIGTLEVHPIDLLGAYGTIANSGVLMPRTTITNVIDDKGDQAYPDPTIPMPEAREVISPQAAYIITDILAGNTNTKVNPFWGEWAVYDGKTRRPAAYKTGTTNDNRDTHAYGYLAPPEDPTLPALAVGVWMGNSNNEPNTDTLSLASSAPLWSRIMRDVSKGLPIEGWHRPSGLVEANVDAFTGMRPGPFTSRTVPEIFIKGTAPSETDNFRRSVDDRLRERPAVAGRMRRAEEDGRRARLQQRGDPSSNGPTTTAAGRSGPRGAAGVRGGPGGHPHLVLLRQRLLPLSAGAGAASSPRPSSARSRSPSRRSSAGSSCCHPARATSRRTAARPASREDAQALTRRSRPVRA